MIQTFSELFVSEIEKITRKRIDEIEQKDLDAINIISFNQLPFKDKKRFNFSDLIFLKSLKAITLSGFDIQKDDIEVLNMLPNISFIQFDFCDFKCDTISIEKSLDYIVFEVCNGISINSLYLNTKSLEIIGLENDKKKIDVTEMNENGELKTLSINNFAIKNIDSILNKMPKLELLNIDGSIVNSNDLKAISFINHSHKEKYVKTSTL